MYFEEASDKDKHWYEKEMERVERISDTELNLGLIVDVPKQMWRQVAFFFRLI